MGTNLKRKKNHIGEFEKKKVQRNTRNMHLLVILTATAGSTGIQVSLETATLVCYDASN